MPCLSRTKDLCLLGNCYFKKSSSSAQRREGLCTLAPHLFFTTRQLDLSLLCCSSLLNKTEHRAGDMILHRNSTQLTREQKNRVSLVHTHVFGSWDAHRPISRLPAVPGTPASLPSSAPRRTSLLPDLYPQTLRSSHSHCQLLHLPCCS